MKSKCRPDYAKLYPGTTISAEVLDALKKGDRKEEYLAYDLKRERWIIDREARTAKCISSREDSLDRLVEENRQFADDGESVESAAVKNVMLKKLRSCLDLLAAEERVLIDALFFENDGEGNSGSVVAQRYGVTQQAINKRLHRILRKLKNFLEN